MVLYGVYTAMASECPLPQHRFVHQKVFLGFVCAQLSNEQSLKAVLCLLRKTHPTILQYLSLGAEYPSPQKVDLFKHGRLFLNRYASSRKPSLLN